VVYDVMTVKYVVWFLKSSITEFDKINPDFETLKAEISCRQAQIVNSENIDADSQSKVLIMQEIQIELAKLVEKLQIIEESVIDCIRNDEDVSFFLSTIGLLLRRTCNLRIQALYVEQSLKNKMEMPDFTNELPNQKLSLYKVEIKVLEAWLVQQTQSCEGIIRIANSTDCIPLLAHQQGIIQTIEKELLFKKLELPELVKRIEHLKCLAKPSLHNLCNWAFTDIDECQKRINKILNRLKDCKCIVQASIKRSRLSRSHQLDDPSSFWQQGKESSSASPSSNELCFNDEYCEELSLSAIPCDIPQTITFTTSMNSTEEKLKQNTKVITNVERVTVHTLQLGSITPISGHSREHTPSPGSPKNLAQSQSISPYRPDDFGVHDSSDDESDAIDAFYSDSKVNRVRDGDAKVTSIKPKKYKFQLLDSENKKQRLMRSPVISVTGVIKKYASHLCNSETVADDSGYDRPMSPGQQSDLIGDDFSLPKEQSQPTIKGVANGNSTDVNLGPVPVACALGGDNEMQNIDSDLNFQPYSCPESTNKTLLNTVWPQPEVGFKEAGVGNKGESLLNEDDDKPVKQNVSESQLKRRTKLNIHFGSDSANGFHADTSNLSETSETDEHPPSLEFAERQVGEEPDKTGDENSVNLVNQNSEILEDDSVRSDPGGNPSLTNQLIGVTVQPGRTTQLQDGETFVSRSSTKRTVSPDFSSASTLPVVAPPENVIQSDDVPCDVNQITNNAGHMDRSIDDVNNSSEECHH
ncbi:Uncharacterised protein PB.2937, partial [Pycnogonum litorale]